MSDMNPRLNAVDMSTYGGEFTPAEAACMYEAGVRVVIVGSGHPNSLGRFTEQQARVAVNAGLKLHVYRWIKFADLIVPQMKNAYASLGAMAGHIEMFWIDVEDTDARFTPEQRITKVKQAVLWCQDNGLTAGIYSAKWYWPGYMGNTEQFNYLPLWNAWYDGDPDTDGVPYGGWTDSDIEQYQGTTDLCGQSVDLNFAKRFIEEDTLTPEEREILDSVVRAMGGMDAIKAWNANENSLLLGYTLEQAEQNAIDTRLATVEATLDDLVASTGINAALAAALRAAAAHLENTEGD